MTPQRVSTVASLFRSITTEFSHDICSVFRNVTGLKEVVDYDLSRVVGSKRATIAKSDNPVFGVMRLQIVGNDGLSKERVWIGG